MSKTWRLIQMAVALNLKRLWHFRASLLLEATSSLAYAGITIVFWQVVYTTVRPLPGWSLGETFAFVACLELFYALSMSVFIASGKLWQAIVTGRIDVYLIRPVDARLLLILLALRLENLIRSLPSIALLTTLAMANGTRFTLSSIIGAIAVVVLGAVAYACLQMAGSWVSFWLGRTQVLDEVTDSLTEFAKYPHTIFPKWARIILMSAAPMAFAATAPAQVLIGSDVAVFAVIGAAAVIGCLWWAVQEVLWRRGLRRYDSFGG